MKRRKNVSFEEDQIKILVPLIKKHDGNFSAAVRELVSVYETLIEKYGNLDEVLSGKIQKGFRDVVIDEKIGRMVPVPLYKWFTKQVEGCVPPMGLYNNLVEKYVSLMKIEQQDFEDYIRIMDEHLKLWGVTISQKIQWDDTKNPTKIRVQYEGEDPEDLYCHVAYISHLFCHHPFLFEIKSIKKSPTLITVDYTRCKSEDAAYLALVTHFGQKQQIFDDLKKMHDYWRNVFKMAMIYDYDLVILPKENFQKILRRDDIADDLLYIIENAYGKLIEDFQYDELLGIIGEIGSASGIINKVDYTSDEISIYHSLDDANFIKRFNGWFLDTMRKAGHEFKIKTHGKLSRFIRCNYPNFYLFFDKILCQLHMIFCHHHHLSF